MEIGKKERHNLTVFWRIENILIWKTGNDVMNRISSPFFTARTLKGKRFTLDLRPNASDLRLHFFMYDDPLFFPIDCEWSFIGSNGSTLVDGIRKHVMCEDKSLFMSDCPTHEEVFLTRNFDCLPQDTLTVRFRVWRSDGNLSNNELVSCHSRCESSHYSLVWHIPNFSALQLNQRATTTITLSDTFQNHKFRMMFLLKGASLSDSDASVELAPVAFSPPSIVTLKVSVLGDDQKGLKGMEINSKNFCLPLETWIISRFARRDELLREKNKCLRDDVLTLRCEIRSVRYSHNIEKYDHGSSNLEVDITKGSSTFLDASSQTSDKSDGTLDVSLHREDPLAHLVEDLLGLYQEQRLSDFELRAGDISFPVHKIILSARSPVFKAMFSSDMKESESNSQDVPDLDVHTLNRLLTFLYAGTVEQQLQWEGAAKLYYAADKYQVQSLKNQCCSILRSNISISNVSQILKLADRHEDKELISFTHEFALNNFDEIMESDEWENFLETDPIFAGKTAHQLYKKKLQMKRT